MHYCREDIESMIPIWHDHGICRCFLETVTDAILLGFMVICGSLEWFIITRFSTATETKNKRGNCWYVLTVVLTVILAVEGLVEFIFRETVLGDGTIYGYELFTGLCTIFVWLFSLKLRSLARNRIIPSMPPRGHGIVLLLFCGLVFIKENLAFVSWESPAWFWSIDSFEKKFEFSLWATRYVCTLLLLIIGLVGPGIPRSLTAGTNGAFHDRKDDKNKKRRNQSTWKNFFVKMKKLLPYVWPHNNILLQITVFICLLLLAAGRVVNVFVPLYYKKIVNSLTPDDSTVSHEPTAGIEFRWDLILTYVGLVFIQGMGSASTGFINNARTFLWIKVQQYTGRQIQLKVLEHLHALSLRWHIQRKTGEVLRIVARGRKTVYTLLTYVVFNIVPTFVDVIVAIVFFTTTFDYIFGIVVFLSMALYLACTILVTEWRTKFKRRMNQLDNETNAIAVDSLINFESVKFYGTSDFERKKYDEAILRYQKSEWESLASMTLLDFLQNTVISIGLGAGALLFAWAVYHGINHLHLEVGDFVLFGTYVTQLYAPLNGLGTYYRMVQQSFIDMENMLELLDVEIEVKDLPHAEDIQVNSGKIEFKDVCFHYDPEKPLLKNISFVVEPGETFALVGHSGSGKSTIIQLLFRLYDVNSGVIEIDGTDISLVNQESLRKSIGVVPQETVLFNNNIRYNIRYGRSDASDEEVERAAEAAEIHNRIQKFTHGYDSLVGERGLKLSGGEKQRVGIARTLLRAPNVVLLDEATSALDTKTERSIQTSLVRACENKTSIIVAHRLSTIIHAHQIIVLSEGEIVERGTHEELLKLGEHYADMWLQQQAKKDDENGDDETNEVLNVKL